MNHCVAIERRASFPPTEDAICARGERAKEFVQRCRAAAEQTAIQRLDDKERMLCFTKALLPLCHCNAWGRHEIWEGHFSAI